MKVVTIDDTVLSELQLPHARTAFRNYVGRAGVLADGPQAYLVHMPDEGSFVPPHFHDIDQFQIALEGAGRFGKKPWQPGTFHYADAYGPYGPIHAGPGGISFLTLRVASSSGQFDMPGSRHRIPGRLGKSATGGADISLPAEAGAATCTALAMRPDGMRAMGLRLGPHARAPGMENDGGGQYYVVCAGGLVDAGRTLPRFSLLYVAAGEDAPAALQAGPEGAVVVALQFPRPSERPGSDPAKLAQRDYSVEYVVA